MVARLVLLMREIPAVVMAAAGTDGLQMSLLHQVQILALLLLEVGMVVLKQDQVTGIRARVAQAALQQHLDRILQHLVPVELVQGAVVVQRLVAELLLKVEEMGPMELLVILKQEDRVVMEVAVVA